MEGRLMRHCGNVGTAHTLPNNTLAERRHVVFCRKRSLYYRPARSSERRNACRGGKRTPRQRGLPVTLLQMTFGHVSGNFTIVRHARGTFHQGEFLVLSD